MWFTTGICISVVFAINGPYKSYEFDPMFARKIAWSSPVVVEFHFYFDSQLLLDNRIGLR